MLVPSLLGAVAAAVTGIRIGWSPTLPAFCCLAAGLAVAGTCDARSRRLPKRVVHPTLLCLLAGLTAAAGVDSRWALLAQAAAAGVVLLAFFGTVHLAASQSLAFGDVRLALPVGCGLGWYGPEAVVAGLGLGFILAGTATAVLLAVGRIDRKAAVPLGSYLAAGTLFTIWALGPAG